jgi:hypothetical protein
MTRQLARPDAEELYAKLSVEANRRRRRRRLGRSASVVVTAALAGSALVWAIGSLLGLRSIDTAPADEEPAPNYVFSDIEVVDGPVFPWSDEADGPVATVLFRYSWSANKYPGDHACTTTVVDEDGTVIGRVDHEVASMMPEATRRFGIGVPIVGEPARADIACGPRRLDTPVAYEIVDERLAPNDDGGVDLVYGVAWPEGVQLPDYPGENACTAWFELPGEWRLEYDFTLSAPAGHRDRTGAPPRVEPTDVSTVRAGVDCHAYSEADLPRWNVDQDGWREVSP